MIISVSQKIDFGVNFLIIAILLILSLLLAPAFILTKPHQMISLQWCMWATNVLIAMFVFSYSPKYN